MCPLLPVPLRLLLQSPIPSLNFREALVNLVDYQSGSPWDSAVLRVYQLWPLMRGIDVGASALAPGTSGSRGYGTGCDGLVCSGKERTHHNTCTRTTVGSDSLEAHSPPMTPATKQKNINFFYAWIVENGISVFFNSPSIINPKTKTKKMGVGRKI